MKNKVYNLLSFYRKKNGYTQTELGKLCGLSQNTISSIETYEYNCTIGNALKICKVLNEPVENVFILDD